MIILIDFVVMDIREDTEVPILLGRHFLAMDRAVIDVKHRKLTLEVKDENIKFILSKLIKIPTFNNSCYRLNILKRHVGEPPLNKFPLTYKNAPSE